jgi:hypothetical protein
MRANLRPFLAATAMLALACAHRDAVQRPHQEPNGAAGGGDSEEGATEPAPYETPGPAGPPIEPSRKSNLDRAGTGAGLEFGLAGGGDDLVTATYADGHEATMAAGGLLLVALNAEWTPIRTRAHHGFGVGLSGGIKYNSLGASNGSVRFLRFPVIASAHALWHVKQKHFFLTRAGLEKDLAPTLSGDGLAAGLNLGLSSHIGALGEAGIYWQAARDLGIDLKVRYTWIEYRYGRATIDGSSVAFLATVHVPL